MDDVSQGPGAADEPASSGSAPQPETPEADESRSSGGGRWLAALKTIVGLDSPTLRDTIEDALKSNDNSDPGFTSQEREMLLRLLQYSALRVEDVMVPRADIIAVDENESVERALQTFVEAGVSRMPLFHESLDDPRGIIHIKDVVTWLTRAAAPGEADGATRGQEMTDGGRDAASYEGSFDNAPMRRNFPALDFSRLDLSQSIAAAKIGRSVIYVPPSMPAMNLLLRMQSTRKHMALVVDEYGGTDGLVTIEDLIEQIVGQIEDEHDEDEELNIAQDARLGLTAAARTPVDELEIQLGINLALDDDDDIDTIGGLVFSLAGRVPVRGEIVRHPAGVEFEVLDADPRRIKRLRVIMTDPHAAEAGGDGGATANGAA